MRPGLTRRAATGMLAIGAWAPVLAADPPPDPWLPLRRLLGDWSGTSAGQSGEARVTRSYAWVLNGRYIHETNLSVYPPQERNKAGERHEHWALFSFDRARKTLVLRQFHVEGFVNTYRRSPPADKPDALIFDSESFENFSNTWRARESLDFITDDELVETFELAPPGKDFQVYSRTRLLRQAPPTTTRMETRP